MLFKGTPLSPLDIIADHSEGERDLMAGASSASSLQCSFLEKGARDSNSTTLALPIAKFSWLKFAFLILND